MQTDTTSRETIILAISAPELAELVQHFLAGEPAELAPRITKAAGYVVSGHYHDTAEMGVYTVDGCEGRTYTTTSGRCTCPWGERHIDISPCAHQFGARIISAASAVAAWDACQTRVMLTAKGNFAAAALAARA